MQQVPHAAPLNGGTAVNGSLISQTQYVRVPCLGPPTMVLYQGSALPYRYRFPGEEGAGSTRECSEKKPRGPGEFGSALSFAPPPRPSRRHRENLPPCRTVS